MTKRHAVTGPAKAVKATELNVWALAQLFRGALTITNVVPKVYAPHIRRCISAGIVEVADNGTLSLTAAGAVAVAGSR